MSKHFYSHIVDIESIHTELNALDMSHEERLELILILESSIHHVVIDRVLSELSEEDKKIFLSHLMSDKHDEIWKLLNEKVDKIEEKIKKEVADLKKEIHEDIKESKEHI
jgi:hypothetical protein